MPDSNRLTPPAGEPVPNPLFDIAVTLAPDEGPQDRQTFSFTPEGGPATRTIPPDGDPNTNTFTGPHPAAGHVRTHLPGYDILGILGRGGMGVVYKARQIKLNRVVALKLMLHADHASATTRGRFATEAQAVAKLQHPNIVQVFEVGEIDGVPYFSLEYVPGGTLAERVSEHLLPPRDAAALVAALASAVQYAHAQGIIHRDLKPTNILLASGGCEPPGVPLATSPGGSHPPLAPIPKIADFGLAKSLTEDSGITRSGSVVGTPSYMPPEQAAGDSAAIGPAADIYSLGAVLYELLTGRPPFKGANIAETLALVRTADPTPPSSLQAGVPRDLETICLKCLRKEPAQRYATAAELADDIGRYLRGEPILARPVGKVERAWRWCKRNPGVASLMATVATLLVCITVGASAAAVRINQKRNEAAFHQKVAEDRLRVYQKAVDRFVNEAPSIVEGHPLGSSPTRDLLELGGTLLQEVQGTGVDDTGLGKRGEMTAIIRKGHLAKAEGRIDDAARHYDDAFKMGEELLRTTTPEEKGKNTGNLALVVSQRATVLRTRAEIEAAKSNNAQASGMFAEALKMHAVKSGKAKARGLFADAVKMHDESIAMFRRVLSEPDMRDIHVAEAEAWLAGAYCDLAETHRLAAGAAEGAAGRRAAHEAAHAAALRAVDHYAAWQASGWNERNTDRTRLRQAIAAWEVARAADKLGRDDEADAAFARSFGQFTALVRDTPKNLLHRIHFSNMAADQGDFLALKRSDPKRAGVAYAAATDQVRRIGKPGELRLYSDTIGANLYRQGMAALGVGDPFKARDFFLQSVTSRRELLEETIRDSAENSPYTTQARVRLMFSQARAGDHAAAAAFAARLRQDHPTSAYWMNYATQGFSICSSMTDDTDEEAEYRTRAFECLERALDAGYADAEQMTNDADFSPLRGDPRFPPLLARAKASAAKK